MYMFILLESEIITLILSQNYDSNISRQLLNSFKTLTMLSILWSAIPLREDEGSINLLDTIPRQEIWKFPLKESIIIELS